MTKLSTPFFYFVILLLLTPVVYGQIPPGYYNSTAGLTGSSLKTSLYNIINGHTVRSYDDLWDYYPTTDKTAANKVWDMYSNCTFTFVTNQCGEFSVECDCFNREHSFPASWFNNGSPMYSDLFHVIPTDGKVNNVRDNEPFGEVGTPTYTSTNGSKRGNNVYPGYAGTVFEPADEYKGDFARTYFYMVTRYENLVATWYSNSPQADAVLQNNAFPVFETWFLNMLGEWHVADPVSQKEINRNNAVYGIQSNRNPFIDHPEWVYSIWGVGTMLDPEPANHATDFSAHTITLNWADATGATLPDGYLVRMSNQGFDNILAPDDGIPVTDNFWNKNIPYGKRTATFSGLTPNTVYFFKIFGYRGAGATISYKTDGAIQQVSIEAK